MADMAVLQDKPEDDAFDWPREAPAQMSGKEGALWTPALLDEVDHTFVEHPDYGDDDFLTRWQMPPASQPPGN